MKQVLSIILGIPFITFLPGFCLSYLFFKKNEIKLAVRILLSFILTILSLPISVFIGLQFGYKLNFDNILIAAITISAGSVILFLISRKVKHVN